ncbi:MAG: type II toxin-antitoxin system HicB family antitoxin [Methanococcaceae archaeon]
MNSKNRATLMTYKGYTGKVEFDEEAGIFHGEVIDTKDVITFQAENAKKLRKAFEESVDDYIEFCLERGEEPDKPFSGQFVLRIPQELHREIYIKAASSGTSINSWVTRILESAIRPFDLSYVSEYLQTGNSVAEPSAKGFSKVDNRKRTKKTTENPTHKKPRKERN